MVEILDFGAAKLMADNTEMNAALAKTEPKPVVNPHGPEKGEKRVIRGGGWNGSYATWLRPSFRYAQVPDALSHGIGFRCARALDTD